MAKKRKGRNYVQGKYEIKNTDKYMSTKDYCTYRSSWEHHFFKWADHHDSVLEWGSETVVVPYYDPIRQRNRRYMVDVYLKVRDKNGEIVYYLIEIKPYKQTLPPTKTSKKRQDVYESEVVTFTTNQCKWKAAQKYAEARGWKFIVMTEYQIFNKT